MYTNNPGHMTKMAAMPIYVKNPSKIFSAIRGPISKKLGMAHRWLKYYNVYINQDCDDLDLFYGKVNMAFEWVRLLKLARNWQMDRILIILKK